jgi:hypothetical protein
VLFERLRTMPPLRGPYKASLEGHERIRCSKGMASQSDLNPHKQALLLLLLLALLRRLDALQPTQEAMAQMAHRPELPCVRVAL